MLVILNVSLCNYRYTMHLFGKNKYKKERKKKGNIFFFSYLSPEKGDTQQIAIEE